MPTSRLMQENLPNVPHRRRIAAQRSQNVGKIVESWTLRGRDARIDNTQRLEMFQAESKWEMSDKRKGEDMSALENFSGKREATRRQFLTRSAGIAAAVGSTQRLSIASSANVAGSGRLVACTGPRSHRLSPSECGLSGPG